MGLTATKSCVSFNENQLSNLIGKFVDALHLFSAIIHDINFKF